MPRVPPGGGYRCFLRADKLHEQHHRPPILGLSFYARCKANMHYDDHEGLGHRRDMDAEQSALHVAERLALLLNQAAQLDVNVAYIEADDESPSFMIEYDEDGELYGFEVSADADGVWQVNTPSQDEDSTQE